MHRVVAREIPRPAGKSAALRDDATRRNEKLTFIEMGWGKSRFCGDLSFRHNDKAKQSRAERT